MSLRIFAPFLLACLAAASSLAQQTTPAPGMKPGMKQEMHEHAPAQPSALLTITGRDGKMLTVTPADLKAMPHKTVTVFNEHAKKNETYAGVPVTDLLTRLGVPSGEAVRGKAFLLYLIAEGTDHYGVVYSLAETDSSVHTGVVLVADTLDGAPITADGAFKLVSTEEKRPARWVRNLSSIKIMAAE